MKVMDDVVGISRVVKVDKAKAVLDGDLTYVAIVLEESLDVSVGGISREMAQVNTSWHLNVFYMCVLVMRGGEVGREERENGLLFVGLCGGVGGRTQRRDKEEESEPSVLMVPLCGVHVI